MADKIFPKRKLKKHSFLLFIVILTFGVITIVGLVAYKQEGVDNWEVYKNSELGYEIQYPAGWYVKEESQRTKVGEGVVCIEELAIENKKERVALVEAGPCEACEKQPITKNGSYFRITIFEVPSHISSTEDWIQSLYIPERVKQQRLAAVQIIEIGGERMEVWKGPAGGIEFFNKGKVYQVGYASNKPFKRDVEVFEKMLASFKINREAKETI